MAFYLGGAGVAGGKQCGRAHSIDARAAGGSLGIGWENASPLQPAALGKRVTGPENVPSKTDYAQFLKDQMAEKGGGRRALSESRRFAASPSPGLRGLGVSMRDLKGGAGSRDPSPFARLGGAVVNLPDCQKKAAYAEHAAELRDELSRRNESKVDAYKRRLAERDDAEGPEAARDRQARGKSCNADTQEDRQYAMAQRADAFQRYVGGSGSGDPSETSGAHVFAEAAGVLKQGQGQPRRAMPPRPNGSFSLG